MSLFTDSNIASSTLLLAMEPEAQNVLDSLGKGRDRTQILLDNGPLSLVERAWSECRSKLESALASFSIYVGQAGSQAHLNAVLNTGLTGGGTRPRIRLDQIVASDTYYANTTSPVEQWVAYSALRLLFESAALHFAGKDLKGDRYLMKEAHYAKQQVRLWNQVVSQGLPFLVSPFPCPGSFHGWNAGTWDVNNLSYSPDFANTNATDQDIRITITYCDTSTYKSPTVKNNGESGPGQKISTTVPAGQLLSLDITSLNPPGPLNVPETGLSQGVIGFMSATAYNVYVGLDQERAPMYLQNSLPIPINAKTSILPATFLATGPMLTRGQIPDSRGNILFGQVLARG